MYTLGYISRKLNHKIKSHQKFEFKRLPKWAPSNIALTQVLVAGGLLYEQLHLLVHVQGALMLKVVTWTRE